MSTRFDSISQLRASSNTLASTNHDISLSQSYHGPGPTGQLVGDPPMPTRTCHSAPHDAQLEMTTRWQKDLDDHFTYIFTDSVLSQRPIDDRLVAWTVHLIATPTQAKIRVLALTICTHWMRLQFRYKNVRVYASEIVILISRIGDHLRRTSVLAQTDFFDQLNYLCFAKLKLMWRWVRS